MPAPLAPLRLWISDDFVDAPTLERLRALTTPQALAEAGVAQHLDVTGRSAEVPLTLDPALSTLAARLEAEVGVPNAVGGTLRFREYLPGQGHPAHLDDYAVGGARLIATCVLNLDDVPAGGATVFPAAERRVEPRAGRLAVWFDVLPDGRADPASLHRAEAVVSGRKRTLVWFVYATAEDVRAALEGAPPTARVRAFGAPDAAAWRPDHTLTVIDDDVPPETIDLLRTACRARRVGFDVVQARALPPDAPPLPPGSLLYCPATSRAAELAELRLFGPGVATFYRHADGPLRPVVEPLAAFERAGLPIPRGAWIHTTDRARLRALLAHVGGPPAVIKVVGGEGGVGVMRVDSTASCFALIDHLRARGATPRLMALVPDAVHWRLVVVADRIVAAYPNPVAADDFRSEATVDPAAVTAAVDPAWAALAVEAAHAIGVDFAGVDLLVHASGRVYVLEANFPCYFPHAQQLGGLDVAGAMVEALLARAAAAAEQPARDPRAPSPP